MTADVVAFLRAALDEVERVARALEAQGWVDRDYDTGRGDVVVDMDDALPDAVADGCSYGDEHEPMSPEQARHIALHDPRAAIARVQAERAILDDHRRENDGTCRRCVNDQAPGAGIYPLDAYSWFQRWPCPTVRWIVYSHRHTVPGFDPAWAPEGLEVDA